MARAALHKEKLVGTAMRLFRRQGYASTGLQQILDESGAPRGSLYHYFPGGKEAIAEAAVRLAGERVAEMLGELAARHRSPASFVRAYAKTMAGWMQESEFRSGCPIATTLLETAPDAAGIREAGREAIAAWVAIVAEVLEREGSGSREARRRARSIIAAMEGALILARVDRSTRPILDVAQLVQPAARSTTRVGS